jgi:molybdopterin-guanine dinucleotide biosynthesis protein B
MRLIGAALWQGKCGQMAGHARVIGLAGWSGAGKTTLIERLIPVFRKRGLSVSTLKHAHHRFDIDQRGKDSWRHREAGANEVLVASAGRWALLHELRDMPEPDLRELLGKLAPVDLVILEGWRTGVHAKIEVWRQANDKPLLHPDDPSIRGLVGDVSPPGIGVPFADSSDIDAVANLLLACAVPASDLEAGP